MIRAARTTKARPAAAGQLDLVEMIEQMERQDAERAASADMTAQARAIGYRIGRSGVRQHPNELPAELFALVGVSADDRRRNGDVLPWPHEPLARVFWDAYYAATAAQPTELHRQAAAAADRRHAPPHVRFRHPSTGSTWTGRGLKPRWVIDALASGMTIDDLAV